MSSEKYLSRLVYRYLPKMAKVLQMQEYFDSPSILVEDLDDDGSEEVVVIYENLNVLYLVIFKNYGRFLEEVWRSGIGLEQVSILQLIQLGAEKKGLLIGGQMKEEQNKKFNILVWKDRGIVPILEEWQSFDKLYCEDIEPKDGKEELIVWRLREKEAYDITIYHIENNRLVENHAYDESYFKTVKPYYEYLCKKEPNNSLYRQCLEEVTVKCKEELAPRCDEETSWIEEEVKYTSNEETEVVLLTTGNLYEGCEEVEVFWLAKKTSEGFSENKLIITKEGKQREELTPFRNCPITQPKLFIGEFSKEGREDLWVWGKAKNEKEGLKGGIYTNKDGKLDAVLSLEDYAFGAYSIDVRQGDLLEVVDNYGKYYLHINWKGREKAEAPKWQIQKMIKCYPLDEMEGGSYRIVLIYPIVYEKWIMAYMVRLVKWDEDHIEVDKEYISNCI